MADYAEKLKQFAEATGVKGEAFAAPYLQACDGDVNAAVAMCIDNNFMDLNSANDEENPRPADAQYTQTLLSETYHHTATTTNTNDSCHIAGELSQGSRAFKQLFQPPKEILCCENFAKAKSLACTEQKWLLVNIQECDSFECMRLNRDIWQAEVVQDMVKYFFIFWQRTNTSVEGSFFIDLYKVHTFPFVGVLDPRTGRLMKTWSPKVFTDPVTVQSELCEFVEVQESLAAKRAISKSPMPSEETGAKSNVDHKVTEAKVDREDSGVKGKMDIPSNDTLPNTISTDHIEPAVVQDASGFESVSSDAYANINNELLELRKLREKRRQPSST